MAVLRNNQYPNSVWTYSTGRTNSGGTNATGTLPPFLIKGRYGEPIITRIYNNTPVSRATNGGFGRNETQLHFHNAHNGAESDGAANTHHFPGTFYDYRWSTTLARRDKINTQATDPRASGPNGNGGLVNVAGDFREIQGTMWVHDHRFFFTAENVYKGNLGMFNMYSGPDRGNEVLTDGVNLRLPSGSLLDFGNLDFDVNLIVSDAAFDPTGQLFFDIFTTDGFLGDVPLVNFAYAPFFEVLPRKYRFRILNACMSRFLKLALADSSGNAVPFTFIAIEQWTLQNDGGDWDHPIHLHFEEGVTINRGENPIPATERLVRKDVWRLRPSGSVTFQVQFGEYGGAYVNHCHNTVHEDTAMFKKICAPCHTIGVGDRVGPDLRGVTQRRERAWLSSFIQNPAKMRAQQDLLALALAAKYPGVHMPALRVSEVDAADLITYLEAETSRLSDAPAPDRGRDRHRHH